MNLSFTAVIALSLTALMLVVLLRQYRPEFALGVSLVCAALLLIYGVFKGSEIITAVRTLTAQTGIDEQNISLLLKALGICYITQAAKDICIDCGQSSLGDRVDFVGRITIASLSLPLIMQVVTVITELIG